MRKIKLCDGQFAQVDDEDYKWLMQYKWHSVEIDGNIHAMTVVDGECVLMEEMVMAKAEFDKSNLN